MKLQLIFIILFCVSVGSNVQARNSPADAYYQQNLAAENTPADNYYRNNILRAGGPEPGGPGGEEEGDGEFVGGEPKPLPVGEASATGIVLMGAAALLYKHKRKNN